MKPMLADTSHPAPQAIPNAAVPRELAKQLSLDSRVLFAGGRELLIFHYGEPYHLRETRQGKLILTK
jgi:hemin uptake protein HemP